MDQAVLAGIGNVYRCELLFRHRVDPVPPRHRDPARRPGPRSGRTSCDLMPLGVASGQIITMEDQVEAAKVEYDTTGDGAPHGAPLLRLQAHRRAVPRLRLEGAHPAGRRAQPVLVRPLPAPPVTRARRRRARGRAGPGGTMGEVSDLSRRRPARPADRRVLRRRRAARGGRAPAAARAASAPAPGAHASAACWSPRTSRPTTATTSGSAPRCRWWRTPTCGAAPPSSRAPATASCTTTAGRTS